MVLSYILVGCPCLFHGVIYKQYSFLVMSCKNRRLFTRREGSCFCSSRADQLPHPNTVFIKSFDLAIGLITPRNNFKLCSFQIDFQVCSIDDLKWPVPSPQKSASLKWGRDMGHSKPQFRRGLGRDRRRFDYTNTAAKRLRMRQVEHFRSLFQAHFPVRSKSPARSRLHSVCSLWFGCSAFMQLVFLTIL